MLGKEGTDKQRNTKIWGDKYMVKTRMDINLKGKKAENMLNVVNIEKLPIYTVR